MKKIIFALLICLLSVGFIAGCSSGEKNSAATTSSSSASEQTANYNLGAISFQGIDGRTYANIFKDKKMTMVNIMATWCSPCVKELPELQQLNSAIQEKNIGLVAIVADTVESGKTNSQAVADAKILQNQASITFPMLMPDSTGLNGFLKTIQVVPTTIFVDQNGSIIGVVTGSNNYQDWMRVVTDMESKLG